MSTVAGLSSDRDKTRRKSCHRRNDDSGELDLFNAEGYFSSTHESLGHNISGTTLLHELGMMAIRDDCNSSTNASNRQGWREGRVSLDIPAMRYPDSHHYHHHHHIHYHRQHSVSQPQATSSSVAKEKKHKQPSSPGGKLASFFNSLISQAVSKKKKSSKPLSEQESPSSWRWRRSSNNLSSSTTSTSTTSTRTRTSDNSGIRSSPPYPINTPTKSYKNLSSFSVSRSKNPTAKPNSATVQVSSASLDWLDEKFKCIGVLSDQKQSNKGFAAECGGFKRFKEEDGAESDSSSDLFELQLNYECSSGLPVYETTCMDTIKRSSATPITNI